MTSEIRYFVPGAGTVRAVLHNESASLHGELVSAGEIDRLRMLDHLGAVRLGYEGAHHPRWEYIAATLALITRCESDPPLHIGSKVQLSSSVQWSSMSELLKVWALAFNVGHLKWTFAAERLLMLEVWSDRRSREQLISLVPSDVRPLTRAVLKQGRFYEFFQHVAMLRIAMLLPEAMRHSVLFAMAAYLRTRSEDAPSLVRARELFRRIRTVAYLGLDTHYVPTAIRLDLASLLADQPSLRRLTATEPSSGDELASVNAALSRNVYLGARVLTAIASRSEGLGKAVRASLRTVGVLETVEAMARGDIQDGVNPAPLAAAVRLDMRLPPPLDVLGRWNARIEQSRLSGRLRKRKAVSARVELWPVLGRGGWVAQYHGEDLHDGACAVAEALALSSRLRDSAPSTLVESLGEEGLQQAALENVAWEVLFAACKLAFAAEVRWEVARSMRPSACVAPRRTSRQLIQRMQARANKPRSAELRTLARSMVRDPDRYVAVGIGNVAAYLQDASVPLVELDGLYVEERADALHLVMTEAKSGSVGPTAAIKDLRAKLNKLKPRSNVAVAVPRRLRVKSVASAASVRLRIPLN